MSNVGLNRRYAKALFDLAQERGKLDPWLTQVGVVLDAFAAVPGLRAILINRFVDLGKRRQVVDQLARIFALDREVVSFFKLLIDKKRLVDVRAIALLFEDMVDHAMGRLAIGVRSAKPMDAEVVSSLAAVLRDATKLEPKVVVREDPRLIGGFQLSWAGNLYDASVRGHLDSLHRRLVSRG